MAQSSRTIRVASVQIESEAGNKEANFWKIEAFTARAAADGVRLIVFPECCITGYWFMRNLSVAQLASLAEPIPLGPSTQRLQVLAQRHGITIGAGLVEAGVNGSFHNSYVVALPDGTVPVIGSCTRSNTTRCAVGQSSRSLISRTASAWAC
jgi:predicted amidohydrolase